MSVTIDARTQTDSAGTTAHPTEMRRFRVFRYKRGDDRPHYETFEVPVGHRTSVFEALRWIQIHRDRTLALRHSCLHASCGTCGVRVNGKEALACVTMVHDVGREITVDPIANVPVLTDLVVDMHEVFERFPDEHPIIRDSEFLDDAATPEGIANYERYEDCIECGLCISACPVVVTAERYVGPAALAWGERVVEESRGNDVANLLSWANHPDGVWRCHAIFECTAACPSGVNPAARIMSLRGTLLGRRLRRRSRGNDST